MKKLEVEQEDDGTFKVCSTIGENQKACEKIDKYKLVAVFMQFLILIKAVI
jgi:hypothetical protein